MRREGPSYVATQSVYLGKRLTLYVRRSVSVPVVEMLAIENNVPLFQQITFLKYCIYEYKNKNLYKINGNIQYHAVLAALLQTPTSFPFFWGPEHFG